MAERDERQSARPWWRRRGTDDDDCVEIAGDTGHAWWADREHFGDAPEGRRRARPPADPLPPPPGPAVDPSYWSPESLYESSALTDDPLGSPDVDADRWTRERREPVRAADAADPWEILGLDTMVTWAQVVRRHRDLAKRFHPDRHCGADPETHLEAEVRMAEVNAAFDELRRIYQASGY